VDESRNGGWLGSGGMKKGGATGAILLGVLWSFGRVVLRMTPPYVSAVLPAKLVCAIWGDARLSTAFDIALSLGHGCSGLGGGDKGCIGLYMKLCDFTLLFMILQVELRLNKDH